MARKRLPFADVRIEGIEDLQKKLHRMDDKVRKKGLRRAIRKGAKPIRDAARAKAPRRVSKPPRKSGKPLHKTIVVRSARKRRGSKEVSVRVGPTRDGAHAHLQELGTVHHGAQPFLRPAFDEQRGRATELIRQDLEQLIIHEATR